MSPAMPAAASAWPMFDFTEPHRSGPRSGVRSRAAVARTRSSTPSPTGVPVPCASM
ncbi:hypothetical protein O1L60_00155 [Streptomyces diastatochromogenes]|nr:hypothetical protein [Streptomyces diastatochromogenes]